MQADADPRRWLPGDFALAGSIPVPADLAAGTYTMGLALLDPTTEQPAIHLACDAPEADHLYRLTEVAVTPPGAGR